MKWFGKSKNKTIVHEVGNIYVVDAGTYGGDYLVLIEIDNIKKRFNFLTLPDLIKRDIEFDVFERGFNNKVVNFIEKLPKTVFDTCKLQYEAINNNI